MSVFLGLLMSEPTGNGASDHLKTVSQAEQTQTYPCVDPGGCNFKLGVAIATRNILPHALSGSVKTIINFDYSLKQGPLHSPTETPSTTPCPSYSR